MLIITDLMVISGILYTISVFIIKFYHANVGTHFVTQTAFCTCIHTQSWNASRLNYYQSRGGFKGGSKVDTTYTKFLDHTHFH